MRQVLTNLIANAIKFTQSGEIVVRVTEDAAQLVGAEGSGGEAIVRFEVSDTGDGIAPGKLDMIFQPFVQADTSTSRKYGGTGLGLAISGQLVALMGGDCGVSSRLGEGSTFWFTIRVDVDIEQVPHATAPLDSSLVGVAALIVDDNATQRAVLSAYLTDWGMTVTTADSGTAAITSVRTAAAEGRPFAVVLLDQFMPGMGGSEVRDAIVVDPGLPVSLVLMTEVGQQWDVDVAELIVSSSVAKPIRRDELLSCVRVALGLAGAKAAPTEVPAEPHSPQGGPRVGRLLLAEDNPINQKVAVAILSSAGYIVDTVPNGAEAVRAVVANPYDAILMDCQMPELNGYEATAAIRAQGGVRGRTPIIAMTAGARREDQERCLAEGMDSYLAKPVSKDALLALVDRCVRTDRR